MKVLNATPHDITLLNGNIEVKIKKSGYVARIPYTKVNETELFGAPVIRTIKGEMVFQGINGEKLPEPKDLKEYDYMLVSSFVLEEVRGTSWEGFCIAPNTSDCVRDEEGRIVGVRGFVI